MLLLLQYMQPKLLPFLLYVVAFVVICLILMWDADDWCGHPPDINFRFCAWVGSEEELLRE